MSALPPATKEAPSPSQAYDTLIASAKIQSDDAQRQVLSHLQTLHETLASRQHAPRRDALRRGFFLWRAEPPAAPQPHGLYIWGLPGRGKSMLMDLFFSHAPVAHKRRVHFHEFMLEVHRRIHRWRQEHVTLAAKADPILPLADAIAEETRLLCFDEFQVSDVADAMILDRLFSALFARGVVVVMTSNHPPEQLYADGLQRERFLKFIELVQQRLQVVALSSPEDYRRSHVQSDVQRVYFTPLGETAEELLDDAFEALCAGQEVKCDVLRVQGRSVPIAQSCNKVARFTFAELCETPLGAADYLVLAKRFHTVLISGIPLLTPEKRNEAKRFTTLIDALYEHKTKLFCTVAALPDHLYPEGDGAFEFRRCASRLMEMQSEQYLKAPHGER